MNPLPPFKGIQATCVVVWGEGTEAVGRCKKAGVKHVLDGSDRDLVMDAEGFLQPQVAMFSEFVILIEKGQEEFRDNIAMELSDEKCRWAYFPPDDADIPTSVATAARMWSDEISTIDDIPEAGPEKTYTSGFARLDEHGFRITLPAFMPVIGPYGSGKSVLLRQLLVHLWQLHGWKFLLTSFEEKVKPRYHRDLRRFLIGKKEIDPRTGEVLWTGEQIAMADAEIRKSAVFLRRKRGATLDLDRLINRLRFAVRMHGVKVIAIDPVNEIDHQVPKGESKTDYMGRFIMALKALADDHNLLVICCAHPPKDGTAKRGNRTMYTLNDGADTAHYGNKADIGWCVWRPDGDGPTYLHCDKLKDHESMGKPFLAELIMDMDVGRFNVTGMGYNLLNSGD